MSRTFPIFAANWKLNHGPEATTRFFESFLTAIDRNATGTLIFFPPALSLAAAREAVRDRPEIWLGVQNLYWEDAGAFTGELSAPLAREAGARIALVGHSERRHLFGETEAQSARKLRSALDAGLAVIFCVGETLAEREAGRAAARVEEQLGPALDLLRAEELERFLIAYEPVWAIGTGRTATPEDAAEMHRQIRKVLQARFGPSADAVPILYGGSVNPSNAPALLAASEVAGLLVGGASLDPDSFAAICTAAG